jgi:hypothetical protein
MTIKILTTLNASDRLVQAKREVSKLGYNAQAYYAIKHEDAKISFNLSMKDIVSNCEADVLMMFEDDVEIRNCDHFHAAISQLPSDWELCYLGANIIGEYFRYSDNLFKVNGAWTTHAVLYNNPKKLCESYNDMTHQFDDWLLRYIQPQMKSFIISPMIAWQKPHYSPLWNHHADYTNIFDGSANKLL